MVKGWESKTIYSNGYSDRNEFLLQNYKLWVSNL